MEKLPQNGETPALPRSSMSFCLPGAEAASLTSTHKLVSQLPAPVSCRHSRFLHIPALESTEPVTPRSPLPERDGTPLPLLLFHSARQPGFRTLIRNTAWHVTAFVLSNVFFY